MPLPLRLLIVSMVALWPLFAHEFAWHLDKRYIDRNGDMLADTPEDPSVWIDPPTLVFSYAPHEDPLIYKETWQDFLDYLSHITGKKVVYFPYQTNRAQLEAMRYGRLHVSGFNTGSVPEAVNYAGFRPVAIMANETGQYGYHMEILTYKGSGITRIEEIRGRTLVLSAPSSNSGNCAPRSILAKYYGLHANEDYDIIFSGSHERSLLGLMEHRFRIVAVADSVKKRMIRRGAVDPSQIITLYRSRRFPTTAYGYVYNLKPDLAEKIRRAFLSFPWYTAHQTPTSLKRAFPDHDRFIPADYRRMWQDVRILQNYSCNGK